MRYLFSTTSGRVFTVLVILCILTACGGDWSTDMPAGSNNYGWVLIENESTVTTDASIQLYGEAFSDKYYSYNNCPVGPDTSMTLTWTNRTSGTKGYGYLGYVVAYGGWVPDCEHRWTATVPLIAGKNVIVITVSGGTGSGSASIDVLAPLSVLSTLPLADATEVPVTSTISATLNGQIDPQSVTSSSFIVNVPYGTLTGRLAVSGSTVTFTPDNYLYSDTTYTATITKAMKDINSSAPTADYTWKFTTGSGPDTTPPTVFSTSPTNNATGVAVNAAITATFSETMLASTVSAATFTLNNGVTGTVTYSGTTATFTPSSNLAYSTTYTATITTGVRDAAGNAMAAAYTWTFTTGTAGAYFKMPDTGQTTSYTDTFGEDHDYTINPPSYTDNGDGTITDNVTGLIWQKEDDATTRSWFNANTYCSNLTLAGQPGWRLPSRIELMSIVDYGVSWPSINATYFPDTIYSTTYFFGPISSYYWSSTTNADDTSGAWRVFFGSGYSDASYKAYSHYVRCVRGGK